MSWDISSVVGSGPPAAQFPTIGTSVTGQIAGEPKRQQQQGTDGTPKTWPNGDPVMVLVVPIQTAMRDPQVPGDDGKRSLWIKSASIKVFTEAVRAAGGVVDLGDTVTMTYVADKAPTQRGNNPSKVYTFTYVKGAPPSTLPGVAQPQAHGAAPAGVPGLLA